MLPGRLLQAGVRTELHRERHDPGARLGCLLTVLHTTTDVNPAFCALEQMAFEEKRTFR
jgi:hypothetical protein